VRLVRTLATIVASLLVAAGTASCGEVSARADMPGATSTTTTVPPADPRPADPWNVKPTQPEYQPTPVRLHEPDPVRVDIGAIGVGTDLVTLGRQPDGSMEVPRDYGKAGWYTGGPRPGENGPAVIAGHVDSRTGPAVFYRLKELQRGHDIVVTRADGSRVAFIVSRVETYAKQNLSVDALFGPTAESELRVVTCGGEYDFAKRRYTANVVVFASRQAV
jgi:hypothetical protein